MNTIYGNSMFYWLIKKNFYNKNNCVKKKKEADVIDIILKKSSVPVLLTNLWKVIVNAKNRIQRVRLKSSE